MKVLYIIISLILLVFDGISQELKHGNTWVIGQGGQNYPAGTLIDFNKNPAQVSLFEKRVSVSGGTTTCMSDKNGDLLFYSNGCAIWNKNHNLIPNSENIFPNGQYFGCTNPDSDASGIFGAIILPAICNDSIYYYLNLEISLEIYLQNTPVAVNLKYSVLDLEENNGIGAVTQKLIPILSDTLSPGNISCTRHANGRDWWITVLKFGSNCFFSVLLDENGFQEPVKSCTGLEWVRSGVGSSCFSPDGKTYVRYNPQNGIYVYNFDNLTGKLTSREEMYLPDDIQIQSGAAISPSSQYLYISAREHLYQFDLLADTIDNSRELVGIWDGTQDPQSTIFHQSMLAPDGKIYITSWGATSSYHIIHKPNNKGQLCDLEQRGLKFPEKDGSVVWNSNSIPNIPYFGSEPDKSFCDSLLMLDRTFDSEGADFDMTIYPNPVYESVTIELDLPIKIKAVSISDITGKQLQEWSYSALTTSKFDLDTSSLPKGIYFLSLATEKGSRIRKFVKV